MRTSKPGFGCKYTLKTCREVNIFGGVSDAGSSQQKRAVVLALSFHLDALQKLILVNCRVKLATQRTILT